MYCKSYFPLRILTVLNGFYIADASGGNLGGIGLIRE